MSAPEDENAPSHSMYLAHQQVQRASPARASIGSHEGASGGIRPPAALNYLHVQLKDGERGNYAAPAGHNVA
jgi:redox-sensitive bicupin YhaK (pirin superfamily)